MYTTKSVKTYIKDWIPAQQGKGLSSVQFTSISNVPEIEPIDP